MKNFVYFIAHTAILLVAVSSFLTVARKDLHSSPHQNHYSEITNLSVEGGSGSDESNMTTKGVREEVGMELYPTGSTLPDCSHACGPCFPCKRVMVSFKCPMVESCPVVYRCMCKGKYYQVPSN